MNGLALVLLLSVPPVDETFWSFLQPGTVLERCPEASADLVAARAAWEALDERLGRLKDTEDVGPALAALRDLLRLPCMRLAAEQGPPPWPENALALRTWWQDGGRWWLASYLRDSRSGSADDLRSTTTVPPDARSVLTPESVAGMPLARLVCALGDWTCGEETQGWVERARRALVPLPAARTWWGDEPPPPPEEGCAAEAEKVEPSRAYTTWRTCLGEVLPRTAALPLGRVRPPTDGWLVVVGRRGHYEFCDEARAYDLATGAAWVASSCSALALQEGGSVDFGATDAARDDVLKAGSLLPDNLRQAAWMILMLSRVENRRVEAQSLPVPRGVAPRFVAGPPSEGGQVGGTFSWNSGQTRLSWAWTGPAGEPRARGELTWPSSDDRAATHAVSLLDIAERSFVAGCPPARVPPAAFLPGPGVSGRDASPELRSRTESALIERLTARQPPACGPGR